MLDDICKPDKEVARWLGISVETLRRYKRKEQAPRPVMHALFFQTRWGLSVLETEMHNRLALLESENAMLRRRVQEMQGIIRRLEIEAAEAWTGAANAPVWHDYEYERKSRNTAAMQEPMAMAAQVKVTKA